MELCLNLRPVPVSSTKDPARGKIGSVRVGVQARLLPMSDDPITTRVDAVDELGESLDLHFQEYWVRRGARDHVKSLRYEGAARARPAPGALEALAGADAIVICPSNPI